MIDGVFVGAGPGSYVCAKLARWVHGCGVQRIERQHRTGVLGGAQVRECRSGIAGVVDDHGRDRLTQCRLHGGAPFVVDVDEIEQRADTAGSFVECLGAECLCIDRRL